MNATSAELEIYYQARRQFESLEAAQDTAEEMTLFPLGLASVYICWAAITGNGISTPEAVIASTGVLGTFALSQYSRHLQRRLGEVSNTLMSITG